MKKTFSKKLSLKKSDIASLSQIDLKAIQGGSLGYGCTDTCVGVAGPSGGWGTILCTKSYCG